MQYKEDYFAGTGNVIGGIFYEGAASATDLYRTSVADTTRGRLL
ncbi:hypothetical protein [Parachryseolinea silvisoli]|nr:hypothetical protein [Parachryseolinea silvisoli]